MAPGRVTKNYNVRDEELRQACIAHQYHEFLTNTGLVRLSLILRAIAKYKRLHPSITKIINENYSEHLEPDHLAKFRQATKLVKKIRPPGTEIGQSSRVPFGGYETAEEAGGQEAVGGGAEVTEAEMAEREAEFLAGGSPVLEQRDPDEVPASPSDDDSDDVDEDIIIANSDDEQIQDTVVPPEAEQVPVIDLEKEDDQNPPDGVFYKMGLRELVESRRGKQERDARGKPKNPTSFSNEFKEHGTVYKYSAEMELPFADDTLQQAIDVISEVNGMPCLDPEHIALGGVTEEEYFLCPNTIDFEVCPPEKALRGIYVYNSNMLFNAQIYTLAKNQARNLKLTEDQQVKWAFLRVQAFNAGWYDNQKYSRFSNPPRDSLITFMTDLTAHKKEFGIAWKLAAFLPFVHELNFRQRCATWSSANSQHYDETAKRLASSASIYDEMSYLPPHLLYGTSLRWIGVERVMAFYKSPAVWSQIPNSFRIRLETCPSGTALISCTRAAVMQLSSADYWDAIAEGLGYDFSLVECVYKKIISDPFKYHMLPSAYGLQPLPDDDARELKDAKARCDQFAPCCHAYVVVSGTNTNLYSNKVLKNAGEANFMIYNKFKSLFLSIKKRKVNTIEELITSSFGRNRRTAGKRRHGEIADGGDA